MKSILLAHLQTALLAVKAYIANILTAITNAIIELDQKKADKPTFFSFTLPISAWQASDEGSAYAYYATLAADVTSADMAEVTLSPQTLKQLSASICPTGETLDGALMFWADEIPNVDISGMYEIKRTEG